MKHSEPQSSLPSGPSLAKRLVQAARFLGKVRSGQSSELALEGAPAELAASTRALGFLALRRLGLSSFLLRKLVDRRPHPDAENLLLVSLALLAGPDEDGAANAGYADFTVVNQTVMAAKVSPRLSHASGFINACLRRFLREREPLIEAAKSDVEARWNCPAWWSQQALRDHPRQGHALLDRLHRRAPMVLRVCPPSLNHALDAGRSPLHRSGHELPAHQVGEFAWALSSPGSVHDIDEFKHGSASVQDAAAQLAAPMLLRALQERGQTDRTPWRILDACAAPGGKTTHLIEFSQLLSQRVEVTALDIDAARCARIEENLQRCKTSARVLVADAADTDRWWDGQPFDAILLDAPCSASGIVRRHPDIPWLRRASDIPQLAAIQSSLLDALWPLLKPNGVLLYCTCSIFRAEGADQIEAFLSRNSQARLLPSPGHLLPGIDTGESVLPENPLTGPRLSWSPLPSTLQPREHDGFFYALLHKHPSL